jgi:hypothetical protein
MIRLLHVWSYILKDTKWVPLSGCVIWQLFIFLLSRLRGTREAVATLFYLRGSFASFCQSCSFSVRGPVLLVLLLELLS